MLDYGEPAHYILTVIAGGGALAPAEARLFRRRVGESDGVEIDSAIEPIDFATAGGSKSAFAIGGMFDSQDVTNHASCEIEHCVMLKRALSATDRSLLFTSPYRDP